MYPDIDTLKKLLLKESYISEADSKAAELGAKTGADYVAHLIQEQLLTKNLLGQALAESYALPFVDLGAHAPDKTDIHLPENIARDNRVIIVRVQDDTVLLATDRPDLVKNKDVLAALPGKRAKLAYTLPEYVEENLSTAAQPLDTRFSKIIEQGTRVAPEIVDEIIKDALLFRTSDIHFEPMVDYVQVRFRVDGNLRDAGHVPKEYYDNVLNRIKVASGMRIDEHYTSQDGSIRHQTTKHHVTDLRVSLIPTVEGEKIVMRVLGSYVQNFELSDIGLDDEHRRLLELYAAKPFGMILTVGPTGSGKTTTLYSLLKMLNKPNVNITTIEDPVEYKVAGANQIQVNQQANMTFARGLRSIVRQDPDIILVGEIRDQETAEISVNAALTGHLLLSTFHANDAATAMPRLVDMGIEPFLLASTLQIIIAQRLVRGICPTCRASVSVEEVAKTLPHSTFNIANYFKPNDNLYIGKGCRVCNGSGYIGRTALYEIIEVTPEMQDLLIHSPSTREIEQLARKQGSRSMFDDGIAKAKRGTTTLAEVLRVVPPSAKAGQ